MARGFSGSIKQRVDRNPLHATVPISFSFVDAIEANLVGIGPSEDFGLVEDVTETNLMRIDSTTGTGKFNVTTTLAELVE